MLEAGCTPFLRHPIRRDLPTPTFTDFHDSVYRALDMIGLILVGENSGVLSMSNNLLMPQYTAGRGIRIIQWTSCPSSTSGCEVMSVLYADRIRSFPFIYL